MKSKNNKTRTLNAFEKIVLMCLPTDKIELCINDCISDFNFNEAERVFKKMRYTWVDLKSFNEYIPDVNAMKARCKNLLYEAFAKLIMSGRDDYSISTGRFTVTAYKTVEKDTIKYDAEIEFILVSWSTNI